MAETQENIYIPEKHLIRDMGEIDVKILGTEEMPHQPSELEQFIYEFARERKVELKEEENALNTLSWTYEYTLSGQKDDVSIRYTLLCNVLEQATIAPLNEAKKQFKELMEKGEFEETLSLEGKSNSVFIMRAPWLNKQEGNYSFTFNKKKLDDYNISKIKAVCFLYL